jgi:predicted N-acetyltransferase YhbS
VVASDLPSDIAKRLPRYPIPAALIGRLAVEKRLARRGLGGILVADAVQKAMVAARTVAMTVVVVDPIDDAAQSFYSAFGFRSLQGSQRRMFLTLPRDVGRS